MTEHLFDPVPGFDQPIAVLKHCHDKIRKQIATMQKLIGHLAQHGATIDAQQAAKSVLQYFNKAAPLHHEDEEQDLMPMLQATATGEDAALLQTLVPAILADHVQMDLAWQALKAQLDAVAAGTAATLSADDVARFAESYRQHMEKEETRLAPMAKRIFSEEQMATLSTAMQKRRGLCDDAPAAPAVPATPATPAAAGAPAPLSGAALADLRKDYIQHSLMEADLLDDPMAQFAKWLDEALKAQVNEANAMSMATVSPDGKPTARILLIKQFDERGFTWFTNYDSEKGQHLAHNPNASLLFFWRELERQVRIDGRVVKTSDEENDKYFYSRPVQSQLSAIASHQSAPIGSRADLERNLEEVVAREGGQPHRPAHWGGYRLQPERIEFWQGRRSRFHDRIVFTRQEDGSWLRQRLQP